VSGRKSAGKRTDPGQQRRLFPPLRNLGASVLDPSVADPFLDLQGAGPRHHSACPVGSAL